MPKFDLKQFRKNISIIRDEDLSIQINGNKYISNSQLQTANNIKFDSKKYGSVVIECHLDVSKKDINNILIIENLAISFKDDLKSSVKDLFNDPKIHINFKLNQETKKLIEENFNLLKTKFSDIDTNYDSYLKITINEFSNINIFNTINELKECKKLEIEKPNIIQNDEIIIDDNDNEKIKNNEDERIEKEMEKLEREIENENLGNENISEEEIGKEKTPEKSELLIEESEEEIQKEDKKNIDLEKSKIKKHKYTKMKNINSFDFENYKTNINNISQLQKFINKPKNKKLYHEITQKIHSNIQTTDSININSLHPIITSSSSKIEIKGIPLNSKIQNLSEEYKSDIIYSFINIYLSYTKLNPNMDLDSCTIIILSFINYLEKIIISKKNKEGYVTYVEKIKQIILSLKLFYILFLNIFIINENGEIIQNTPPFDDNFNLKILSMRKRLLVEWCINEQKNYVIKSNIIDINKNKNQKIFTKQLLSFGQIKSCIDKSSKNKFLLKTKIGNLSKTNADKTFKYFLNNNDDNFILYDNNNPDNVKNNWISFLLQSLIYKENPNDNKNYIINSVKLISSTKQSKDKSSNLFYLIKDIKVYNFNFVLLKIFEKMMNKNSKKVFYYINMLSYNNLFKSNNSDHFVQYIILFILTKILPVVFPNVLEDDKLLLKKHFYLLKIVIEEILNSSCDINSKNDNEEKLFQCIKLIYSSFISNKNKKKLIIDIATRSGFTSIEKIWELYDNDNLVNDLINNKLKAYINGVFSMDKCEYYKAYEHFIESNNFDLALNSYLNYFIYLLNNNRHEINFKKIFKEVSNIKDNKDYLFNDFYNDFYLITKSLDENELTDYSIIIQLLKKYIYEYYNEENEKTFIFNKKTLGIIIELLFRRLNKAKIEKNLIDQNSQLIRISNSDIISKDHILYETKYNEKFNTIDDLINFSNIKFEDIYHY